MTKSMLVFQTDFTYKEGAVCAMYGVVKSVDRTLDIIDGSHELPQYDTWSASYRLYQSMKFWPKDTVFVSVVDPGVGTTRKSVVAKTVNGHYIVTPDNGTLTHLSHYVGIEAVREIDKGLYRKESQFSYTFHGRDVYAYTGALLASGKIDFESVGVELNVSDITSLPLSDVVVEEGLVRGKVDILDVRFGSLWTNITRETFLSLNVDYGEKLEVTIFNNDTLVYQNQVVYGKSFGDVRLGSAILYVNSLFKMGLAINQGSFAKAYNVGVGPQWIVEIKKA